MTKQHFFENVLKMKPSEIGSAIPFNPNGETEVTEEWLIAFIKNLLEERNPWHTGTPTEEGEYLIAFSGAGIEYGWASWDGRAWDINMVDWRDYNAILAWQKIEPYKEKEDGIQTGL